MFLIAQTIPDMTPEAFGVLGVGGILAGFMFMFYRKDIKQYTELWKAATDQLISVIKENTASNTRLIALLETQERNSIRRSDLENIMDRKIMESERRSSRDA